MRTFSLASMHLRSLWNWRSVYLGRLIEPLAYLAFMVVGLNSSLVHVSFKGEFMSYGEYVVPGIVALLGVRAGTASVSDVSNDRKWGVYAFSRLAGLSAMEYFASLVLGALPLVYCQALGIILIGMYLLSGVILVKVAIFSALLLPLFLLCWLGIGTLMGSLIQSYSQRDLILSLVNLPIILTAPIFFSVSSAPFFLRALASINPLTYQADLMRDCCLGFRSASDLVVVCALALVFVFLAILALQRSEWLTSER